jgi:hypothetical protein
MTPLYNTQQCVRFTILDIYIHIHICVCSTYMCIHICVCFTLLDIYVIVCFCYICIPHKNFCQLLNCAVDKNITITHISSIVDTSTTYMYVCMYVCMYLCMYANTSTATVDKNIQYHTYTILDIHIYYKNIYI